MKRGRRCNPRGYDGQRLTSHRISDLLPDLLARVSKRGDGKEKLLLAVWPEVIGLQLAPMAKATSFEDGVLFVKVSNSSLYTLLARHDRAKILRNLRQRFPKIAIKNIAFRMG